MSNKARKPVVSEPVQFLAAGDATPEAAIVINVYPDSATDMVALSVCNASGTWRTETSVPRAGDDPTVNARTWRYAPHHTQK